MKKIFPKGWVLLVKLTRVLLNFPLFLSMLNCSEIQIDRKHKLKMTSLVVKYFHKLMRVKIMYRYLTGAQWKDFIVRFSFL